MIKGMNQNPLAPKISKSGVVSEVVEPILAVKCPYCGSLKPYDEEFPSFNLSRDDLIEDPPVEDKHSPDLKPTRPSRSEEEPAPTVLAPSDTEDTDPSWRWRKRYGDDVDWEVMEEKWDEATSKRHPSPEREDE